METPVLLFTVICILIVVVGWFLTGYSSFRNRKQENVAASNLDSASNSFWFSLSSAQQKELDELDTFVAQEDWVEENAIPSMLLSTNAEKIVIGLANKGFIRLAAGPPRRLASVVDIMSSRPKTKPSSRPDNSRLRKRKTAIRSADVRKNGRKPRSSKKKN